MELPNPMKTYPVAKNPQMLKLTAPVIINLDSTFLVLSDYLLRPKEIDSFKVHHDLEASISIDTTIMTIRPVSQDFPQLSELKNMVEGILIFNFA